MGNQLNGLNFRGRWNADEFIGKTEGNLSRALNVAALELTKELKVVLSKPGPLKTRPVGTVVSSIRNGKTVTETVRSSKPGEPPRRRTGRLRASVRVWKIDALTFWVGTPLKYGLELELGLRPNLKPRPWLRVTLDRLTSVLRGRVLLELRR